MGPRAARVAAAQAEADAEDGEFPEPEAGLFRRPGLRRRLHLATANPYSEGQDVGPPLTAAQLAACPQLQAFFDPQHLHVLQQAAVVCMHARCTGAWAGHSGASGLDRGMGRAACCVSAGPPSPPTRALSQQQQPRSCWELRTDLPAAAGAALSLAVGCGLHFGFRDVQPAQGRVAAAGHAAPAVGQAAVVRSAQVPG